MPYYIYIFLVLRMCHSCNYLRFFSFPHMVLKLIHNFYVYIYYVFCESKNFLSQSFLRLFYFPHIPPNYTHKFSVCIYYVFFMLLIKKNALTYFSLTSHRHLLPVRYHMYVIHTYPRLRERMIAYGA